METKYQLPAKFCNQLESKAFWAKIFTDQAASGLSAKKFCKLHQLRYSSYKGHKYRAKPKTQTQCKDSIAPTEIKIPKIQSSDYATKFLPLQITANDAVSQNTHTTVIDQCKLITATYNATPKIQIIFKNDNRLILPATTPEAQLLAIINSVAGLC